MPVSTSPVRRRGLNGRFKPSDEDASGTRARRNLLSWQEILERHQQRFPHSGFSSLVELLLQLAGFTPPPLQGLEPDGAFGASSWLREVTPAVPVAILNLDQNPLAFIRQELNAGRPVGLWYPEPVGRGWALVDLIDIPPHCFVELWSKAHERGSGEGRYSEKRRACLADVLEPIPPEIVHLW